MILPVPSFTFVVGESNGTRICRIVRSFIGCSLHNRRDELGALVGRGVDDSERDVNVKTNCETFALGVLVAAFGDIATARAAHPRLGQSLPIGQEGGWMDEIAQAWCGWSTDGEPPPGAIMLYHSVPYRVNDAGLTVFDDHYEFRLDGPDEHAGGGRPDNAIALEHSDTRWSAGRPRIHWLDPDRIPLPVAASTDAGDTRSA